jgi:predicted nucleotidyltransferase
MHPFVEAHRHAIVELAELHGVSNVRVFGSMARGDATASSDVDLLVSVGPETSGLDLGGLLMDAQDLQGRKVDVVVDRSIHPALRDNILRDAVAL